MDNDGLAPHSLHRTIGNDPRRSRDIPSALRWLRRGCCCNHGAVSSRVSPLGQHQLAVAALCNCGGTLLIDQTLDAGATRPPQARVLTVEARRINRDRRPVSPFVFGGPDVRYSIAGHGCHAARDCAATTVIRSITAWASRMWPTRHMSWVLPWASNIGFNTRCRAARALSARTSESDTG